MDTSNPAYRHGMRRSITYKSWACMIQRCTNPKNTRYRFYGERGITVCERWKDFANFLADMGERPSGNYSIDRIDPRGNYEPSNCRWLLVSKQAANRTNTPRLQYQGVLRSLHDIPRAPGISHKLAWTRIFVAGWPVECAVTERARNG